MNLKALSPDLKQYALITGNYWAFTLTDGALRMLVVLYFHQLGYAPLDIALLFLFYEIFGVVTNLIGGWLGAHLGLNRTMNIGLLIQIIALSLLLVPEALLTVPWVMAAQALSGIAKDLNKMSAKSAIKLLVPEGAEGQLYKWVAALTGSKNALKGVGFFLGGGLLNVAGFKGAILIMTLCLLLVWIFSLLQLKGELGRASGKPKFTHIFSNSRPVNILSGARLFLFGSRDVWFVVALPVYLSSSLHWDHWSVGGFLALWIIGYGLVQGIAPKLARPSTGLSPEGKHLVFWALVLAAVAGAIAVGLPTYNAVALIPGLILFGAVFAINSSLHSYLIVSYARDDGASLDVGFYYMSNAVGRLVGTVLSGWIFELWGLSACLWVSSLFLLFTVLISLGLPHHRPAP